MFVYSHPRDKHPSQAGFYFSGPYQTAPEPSSSSTPTSLLFSPGIFGSGSCLCSAKQLTLRSRWSERFLFFFFQAETHLDQAENNNNNLKKSLIHLPGGSRVGQRLVHPLFVYHGHETKGPPRGEMWQQFITCECGNIKRWFELMRRTCPEISCPSLVGIYHTGGVQAAGSAGWAGVGCFLLVFNRLFSQKLSPWIQRCL